MRPDGVLVFYGPFMLGGTHTAASNAAFDADLKRWDPRWGVRDVDELIGAAAPHGLELLELVAMPANNISLVARWGRFQPKISSTDKAAVNLDGATSTTCLSTLGQQQI